MAAQKETAVIHSRVPLLCAAVLLLVSSGSAKDKSKSLPAYFLAARTVAVVIDPDAGVSLADPQANQVAQKDVETALLNWGRFELVLSPAEADLVVVVRKGSGKLAEETISNPRQNQRPGYANPTDNGIGAGAQYGRSPGTGRGLGMPNDPGAHPQMEIGNVNDTVIVYEGKRADALQSVPGWRYTAKGALRSHTVPAVDEFRKALIEAEKAANKP